MRATIPTIFGRDVTIEFDPLVRIDEELKTYVWLVKEPAAGYNVIGHRDFPGSLCAVGRGEMKIMNI